MRWLAILAILVAGAVGYLAWSLSGPAPQASASKARAHEVELDPEVAPADSTPVATVTPRREPPPPVAATASPTRSTTVTPSSSDRSAPVDAAAASDAPEVEWTEEQRRQQLFTAHGRYEKGNYPGAVAAAMELARRYPPWAEDGYKVAIMAHCAMSEPEKANALYAKMTDKTAIEELTKACTGWGVALNK